MAALLDVNILLALATSEHTHSSIASTWLDQLGPNDAVVCRVAQLGLLRLLNNPKMFPDLALNASGCWSAWRSMAKDERIHFESKEPPGIEEHFERLLSSKKMMPKRWTDAYLAAFAIAAGHRVATFDRGFREFAGVDVELLP